MRFDHLVHWVPDLEVAIERYRELGFPIAPAGRQPDRVTRNAVWRTASAYVEVVALEAGLPATRRSDREWSPVAALIDEGGGALPFALLVDDVAETARELDARGYPVELLPPASVELPDGSRGQWRAAAPRDAPAWAPFLINYGLPVDAEIARYGRTVHAPWGLERIVIETSHTRAATDWLAGLVGVAGARCDRGEGVVPVPGCDVWIVAGPAERITAVGLTGPGAPQGEIAGLRYVGPGRLPLGGGGV